MRVLITGGGSDIAQAIKKKYELNEDVICWCEQGKRPDVVYYQDVMFWVENIRPDVMINCAGVIYPASIKDGDPDKWHKEIEINLIGLYHCCKAAVLYDVRKIVNITSSAGLKGRANWSGYCASKAGAISLTESLRAEGVEAYSIVLHRTDTAMRRRLFPDEDKSGLLKPEYVASRIIELIEKGSDEVNIEI
jgi:3-oxoacyl-[acyl-carrier protein] reductase